MGAGPRGFESSCPDQLSGTTGPRALITGGMSLFHARDVRTVAAMDRGRSTAVEVQRVRESSQAVAQTGRALARGARGRVFKSRQPDHGGVAQLVRASRSEREGPGFKSLLPCQLLYDTIIKLVR